MHIFNRSRINAQMIVFLINEFLLPKRKLQWEPGNKKLDHSETAFGLSEFEFRAFTSSHFAAWINKQILIFEEKLDEKSTPALPFACLGGQKAVFWLPTRFFGHEKKVLASDQYFGLFWLPGNFEAKVWFLCTGSNFWASKMLNFSWTRFVCVCFWYHWV